MELHCEKIEPPRVRKEIIRLKGLVLPRSYLLLLEVANGFVLNQSKFRLFGIETELGALDINQRNQSPWIAEYGELADGLVFFAEDLFGDQYAFRSGPAEEECDLVKFWCEGGEVQRVGNSASLEAWLDHEVMSADPSVMDSRLANAAIAEGLVPSVAEHLSFILPLVMGGEAELGNLEVLDGLFHLHLLGQLSLKNLRLPEGQRIARFSSED